LVVASARNDFPTESELLVLRIAVNQAAMALQDARAFERGEGFLVYR
jgi:GAF domain-containing protein